MSEPSSRLLVVGPTFFNIHPSEHAVNRFHGYIGGYAAWTALAASYAVDRELHNRVEEARISPEKAATNPDFDGSLQTDESLKAAFLTPRMRERAAQKSARPVDKIVITPDPNIRMEDTRIAALTTLSSDHADKIHRGIRAVFNEYRIKIVGSASRMPIDVYDSHDYTKAKIINPIRDERAFDIKEAHSVFANGTEPSPTIAVFNGKVLGDEKTSSAVLDLAQLLRLQGSLIFADLRAPMDAETVDRWASTAHVVKISHHELKKLTGTDSNGGAATRFLNAGTNLFLDTKGSSGASAWWKSNRLNFRALVPDESYEPEVKFKASAAFDANFALALIRFGINAQNLDEKLKEPQQVDCIGNDTLKNTTIFLRDANAIITRKAKHTTASRPIASGPSAESLIRVIYPEYTNS